MASFCPLEIGADAESSAVDALGILGTLAVL
jgi:hypothetical protein